MPSNDLVYSCIWESCRISTKICLKRGQISDSRLNLAKGEAKVKGIPRGTEGGESSDFVQCFSKFKSVRITWEPDTSAEAQALFHFNRPGPLQSIGSPGESDTHPSLRTTTYAVFLKLKYAYESPGHLVNQGGARDCTFFTAFWWCWWAARSEWWFSSIFFLSIAILSLTKS